MVRDRKRFGKVKEDIAGYTVCSFAYALSSWLWLFHKFESAWSKEDFNAKADQL